MASRILSPDGRHVALSSAGGGQVLVRRLADSETIWLAGTEHTELQTWSPDARSLLFISGNELKTVDIATRGVRTIGRVPVDAHSGGAAWNQDGLILIGGSRLRRMSVADGDLADVYDPDPEILDQTAPSFLPDGRRFLYAQDSKNPARRGLFLGALDSREVTRLMPEPANALVSTHGYLLFGRQGTLFAQRFELGEQSPRRRSSQHRIRAGIRGVLDQLRRPEGQQATPLTVLTNWASALTGR